LLQSKIEEGKIVQDFSEEFCSYHKAQYL